MTNDTFIEAKNINTTIATLKRLQWLLKDNMEHPDITIEFGMMDPQTNSELQDVILEFIDKRLEELIKKFREL